MLLKEQDDSLVMISWHNLYVKMMWNLAVKHPAVNLETISRQQILAENLPCTSVKTAVEAGILPLAGGYKKLTAQI